MKRAFFIIWDSSPKLYYLFHFFFLIMIHTWLFPKTVRAFASDGGGGGGGGGDGGGWGGGYFWKYFI